MVDTRPDGGTCNYTHNVANEYLTVCGTAVTHDDAGNLTADHRGYVYEYDMENRLTKVSRSDSTVVATFEYDALGRRIEKVDAIAGTTTRYYYDDQRVAVQTLVSGGVESDDRYFVFGNYIDETLLMHVIPAQAPNQDLYYGHDHLYSPVALFAANGAVAERYEYDVYGFCRILDSNFDIRISSLYGTPYAFTGRELDILDAGNLRLMYYRARTYDPETGRFMQRDPLGINPAEIVSFFNPQSQYSDGGNIYRYVNNNPVIYIDPYGLKCSWRFERISWQLEGWFLITHGNMPLLPWGSGGDGDAVHLPIPRIYDPDVRENIPVYCECTWTRLMVYRLWCCDKSTNRIRIRRSRIPTINKGQLVRSIAGNFMCNCIEDPGGNRETGSIIKPRPYHNDVVIGR